MLDFLNNQTIQEKIEKLAQFFILIFIVSLPLGNAAMNISLAAILVLYFLGGNYLEKVQQVKNTPTSLLLITLFIWMLISAITISTAQPEFIEHDLFKYKKILLLPALIYFINWKNLNIYIYAFLAGTILMILYTLIFDQHGLILSFKTKSLTYNGNPLRNYISEGIFLSISLFATLWFIKNRIHTKLMSLTFLILAIHIIFNNGRMALISALFAVLVFIYFSIQRRTTKLILVACVIGVSYLTYISSALIQVRVDRTIAEAAQIMNFGSAESIRLQYWRISFEKFINSPLFGFGPGSFKQLITDSKIPGEFQEHFHAHQEFLFIALQYGLIGLSLFLGALYFALRKFSLINTSPARIIAYVGILIMILNFMTDSLFYAMTEGHVFIVMLGIYLSKDINDPITKGS